MPFLHALGHTLHRLVYGAKRAAAVEDRQIGEVDIDGKTWQIPDEQVDGRAALEGEGVLARDEWHGAEQEIYLAQIDIIERHQDPRGRSSGIWDRIVPL